MHSSQINSLIGLYVINGFHIRRKVHELLNRSDLSAPCSPVKRRLASLRFTFIVKGSVIYAAQ